MLINYAIEVYTGVAVNVSTIGHTSDGYLRIITGTPTYDGSTVIPKWENTTNNTYVWKEGVLIADPISNVSRRIDIEQTGNYGSVSGLNFTASNVGKIWNTLYTNGISLTNKKIKCYCVIDDVFYAVWNGIVEKFVITETEVGFSCKTAFELNHKIFPPTIIDTYNFPDAIDDSIGQTVPVCIGDQTYAKTLNINGILTKIKLTTVDGNDIYIVPMVKKTYNYVEVLIENMNYTTNYFVGKYLLAVSGKDSNDTKLFKIVYSAPGTEVPGHYTQVLGLDSDPGDIDEYVYDYSGSTHSDDDTWWFSIYSSDVKMVFSEKEVTSLVSDSLGRHLVYNNDEENIFKVVDKYSIENSRDVLEMQGTDTTSNDIETCMTLHDKFTFSLADEFETEFSTEEERTINNSSANINDLDRSTSTEDALQFYDFYEFEWGGVTDHQIVVDGSVHNISNPLYSKFAFFIYPDKNFDWGSLDNLFLGCELITAHWNTLNTVLGIGFTFEMFDFYDKKITLSTLTESPSQHQKILGSTYVKWNFLPNSYYEKISIGNGDNSEESFFYEKDIDFPKRNSIKDYLDISVLKPYIEKKLVKKIMVRLKFHVASGETSKIAQIKFREIGLFSFKNVKTGNNDVYVRVQGGENVSGNLGSNNVYSAFKHILENYDSLTGVDYGNLSTTRNYWNIGKQIIDQSTSFDTLKELAKQSFVGIFESRNGNIKLTSWLENYSYAGIHNDSLIVSKSISDIESTPMNQCYNNYDFKWGLNVIQNKFEKSLSVQNLQYSLSSFPEIYECNDNLQSKYTAVTLSNAVFSGNGSVTLTFSSSITYAGFTVGKYLTILGTGSNTANFTIGAEIESVNTSTNVVICKKHSYQYSWDATTITTADVWKWNERTPKWNQFVTNCRNYNVAKSVWENCKNSRTTLGVVQKAPESLTKLDWYLDYEQFYDSKTNNPSHLYYIQNLVQWNSKNKHKVSYEIPINSTTIKLELLDLVLFSDLILTNNVAYYGYVTKIQVNPKKNTLSVELLLKDFTDTTITAIIETGIETNTIVENCETQNVINENKGE